MSPIHFWFDYISHNAYLSWHRLGQMSSASQRGIVCEPVVFAGLLNHFGGKGPAETPPKNLWMIKNVLRKAVLHDIPLSPPASHPFNPLLSLRATLAIAEPDARNAFVTRMFQAIWMQSKDPNQAQTILDAARSCGLDGQSLLSLAGDPDIKDALHVQNRKAIKLGVFGVPSMVVDEEMFWGFDDMDFLQRYLDGNDPLGSTNLQAWLGIKSSAKRKP